MATGLYSKHLKDRKKLYLRNTVLIIILIVLALISLFPIVYMIFRAGNRGSFHILFHFPEKLVTGLL